MRIGQSKRWIILCIAGMLTLLLILSVDSQDDQSVKSEKSAPCNLQEQTQDSNNETPASPRVSALVAEDIASIRRKLGVNLFNGTSLNEQGPDEHAPGDREFLDALREFPSEGEPWSIPTRFSQDESLSNPSYEEFASGLRQAGLLLDLKANALEHESKYQQADRFRKLAKRLRQVVRESDMLNSSSKASQTPEDGHSILCQAFANACQQISYLCLRIAAVLRSALL